MYPIDLCNENICAEAISTILRFWNHYFHVYSVSLFVLDNLLDLSRSEKHEVYAGLFLDK